MDGLEDRILFALNWVKSIRTPILDVFYALDRVEWKANNTEVTAADRNTESAFRKLIAEKFPNDGIIGEEFSEQNRECDEYTWTIDPIDGTRAFARGVPFFGTMLGLYSNKADNNQEILFGLIAYHALGETIYAIKNKGCFWKAAHLADFQQVQVSTTRELGQAALSYSGEEYFAKAQQQAFIDKLKSQVLFSRTWGDCYGYCLLARGKIDIMCDPQLNKWDLVPIKIIIEEAGGQFLNFDGSATTVNSHYALCANPALMKAVLAAQ